MKLDLEQEKQQEIVKCRRRIDAARHLYLDGDLHCDEYLRRKENNEREIGVSLTTVQRGASR